MEAHKGWEHMIVYPRIRAIFDTHQGIMNQGGGGLRLAVIADRHQRWRFRKAFSLRLEAVSSDSERRLR
jgi:hypothetical protein